MSTPEEDDPFEWVGATVDGFDVELLLIALAPDLDPTFETLYAYLQNDVSRRRASTGSNSWGQRRR